jgi:hypothetical protein
MNIDSVNNSSSLYGAQSNSGVNNKSNKDVDSKKEAAMQRSDTLELSQEARRLQPVRNRIDNGFYNRPDVIREAAARISSQFPAESQNES